MRCALLNDTGLRGNWGSRATSEELLGELRRAFGDNLEFERFPLRKSTWRDAIMGKCLRSSISRRLATSGQVPLGWARFLEGNAIDRLARCDFAVFQSEGTMDGQRFTTAERLLLMPSVAADLGLPVLALNGSAESFSKEFERALVGVYRRFSLIQMREPRSVSYLQGLGLNGVGLNPDSAFLAKTDDVEPPLSGPYICVTGSAVIRQQPWEEWFAATVQAARARGLGVVLLCSGPGDIKTLGAWPAQEGVVSLPLSTSYQGVARVLAGAKALIGGRYHMQILAATVGTPIVFMPSGSHKTEGLLELLGDARPAVEFADHTELTKRLDDLLAHHDRAAMIERVNAIMQMKVEARAAWTQAVRSESSSPGSSSRIG